MDVSALSRIGVMQAGAAGAPQEAQEGGASMFKDILDKIITNVNETDKTFQADIVKAAAGELDNPHQLLIDSSKASIALQLAVSVRNNALEAYNEIIRMQV